MTVLYDVTDYGAKGDGTTNDTVAIQSAINATATGGIVFFPPGTYLVTPTVHPENSAYYAALMPYSNTSILGSGQNQTTIKLSPDAMAGSVSVTVSMLFNRHITTGDSQIIVKDLTFDGNGANTFGVQSGISFLRGDNYLCERVTVRDCRGTAGSGFAETGHFICGLIANSRYVNCTAEGTAGSTAAGFHTNSSTGILFTGCNARGMTVSAGFTHNACSELRHVGCHAHSNGSYGFNSELSFDLTYVGCNAGGYATETSGPYAQNDSLGNGDHGFVCVGSQRVALVGCNASLNGGSGFNLSNNTTARVSGCTTFENRWGVGVDASSVPVVRLENMTFSANTDADMTLASGYTVAPPAGRGGNSAVTPPDVPASDVVFTNPFPMDATVYVAGGVVTAVAIDGYPTGVTSGPIHLGGGSTITITYSVPPTWAWFLQY